jgi:hypothetical protein
MDQQCTELCPGPAPVHDGIPAVRKASLKLAIAAAPGKATHQRLLTHREVCLRFEISSIGRPPSCQEFGNRPGRSPNATSSFQHPPKSLRRPRWASSSECSGLSIGVRLAKCVPQGMRRVRGRSGRHHHVSGASVKLQEAIALIDEQFLGLGGIQTAQNTESVSQQQTSSTITLNNQTILFISTSSKLGLSASLGIDLDARHSGTVSSGQRLDLLPCHGRVRTASLWQMSMILHRLFNPAVTIALWFIGGVSSVRGTVRVAIFSFLSLRYSRQLDHCPIRWWHLGRRSRPTSDTLHRPHHHDDPCTGHELRARPDA